MNNADLFKQTFGIYAEDFWSFDEKQMLNWLNTDVPYTNVGDTISRQAAVKACESDERILSALDDVKDGDVLRTKRAIMRLIASLPSAQPERLTDKEQRIFLAAMSREENVCKKVDEEMTREPYEDSLVRVCKEITRKVKKALWTN